MATRSIDYGSMIHGYLGHLGWASITAASAPRIGLCSSDFRLDWTDVNWLVDASGEGLLERYFTPPANVTGFTVSVSTDLPAGAAANSLVALEVTDTTGATRLGIASVVPPGPLTVTIACVPGTEYRVRLHTRFNGNQQRALMSKVSLVPSNSSDPFFSAQPGNGNLYPFVRYNIEACDLNDNSSLSGGLLVSGLGINPRYQYHDPQARYSFFTSATMLALETYNMNQFGAGSQNSPCEIRVNGALVATVAGPPSNQQGITQVQLGAAGIKRVDICAGVQTLASGSGLGYQATQGIMLVAVYLPAPGDLQLIREKARDKILVYGQSKDAGYFETDPSTQGMMDPLRDSGLTEAVHSKSVAGRWLFGDYNAAGNTVIGIAMEIVGAQPSHVIWDCHRNDWQNGGPSNWTAAQWGTNFAILMDYVNSALPACQQWIGYTTHETTEPNNANGEGLPAYWTQQDTIFTARQSGGGSAYKLPPKKLDFRTLWTSGAAPQWTSDGVHPTQNGYRLLTAYIRNQMSR